MIAALIVGELRRASKAAAIPLASAVQLALLTALVVIWRGGLAGVGDGRVYDLARLLERCLLALLLPWVLARSLARSDGDDLVVDSALAGCRPSSMLAARMVAGLLVAAIVLSASLPGLELARRIAARSTWTLAADLATLIALAGLLVSVQVALLAEGRPLVSWVGGAFVSAAIVAALAVVSSPVSAGPAMAIGALAGTVLACRRADRLRMYLREPAEERR